MTLQMVKNVLGVSNQDIMFFENARVEIINDNTGAHYRKNRNGEMTLEDEPIEASEEWVLGLPVVYITARGNKVLIYVDG